MFFKNLESDPLNFVISDCKYSKWKQYYYPTTGPKTWIYVVIWIFYISFFPVTITGYKKLKLTNENIS
jgi:hypothetical protein